MAADREELLAGEVFGPVDAGVGLGLEDGLLDDSLPGGVVNGLKREGRYERDITDAEAVVFMRKSVEYFGQPLKHAGPRTWDHSAEADQWILVAHSAKEIEVLPVMEDRDRRKASRFHQAEVRHACHSVANHIEIHVEIDSLSITLNELAVFENINCPA